MQGFQPSDNRSPEKKREASQPDSQLQEIVSDTDEDKKNIQQLVSAGYNACFWRDRESFDIFLSAISEPFELAGDQIHQQRLVLKALTGLLDLLRLDKEALDAEGGLVSALAFTRGVLFMESDAFDRLSTELAKLGDCLLDIVRDERYQPSVVLEGESETRIAIAYNAISTFLSCRDLAAVAEESAPNRMPLVEEIVSSGLHAALRHFHSGSLEHASDEMTDLKLSLTRELGNMALCFPSTSFQEPLLQISRICSIHCQQGSLFFPDIVDDEDSWDGEYDEVEDSGERWGEDEVYDEIDCVDDVDVEEPSTKERVDGVWRASMAFEDFGAEYEAISAVCFSALAYCQSGDSLQEIWQHILRKLEPQDIEWCSALVGLSLVDPEQIQVYVVDLLDSLSLPGDAEHESASYSIDTRPLIAMNAVLELLAGNEQAGVQVQAVYRNLPRVQRSIIIDWVNSAIDSGEVTIFGSLGRRQRPLEDQLRFVFDLSDPSVAQRAEG